MHENHENKEAGAALRAGRRKWHVPFSLEGTVEVWAETPREAVGRTEWIGVADLAAAACALNTGTPTEVVA